MRSGLTGYGLYDDMFGFENLYGNFGGYADPAMSLVSSPVAMIGSVSPVPFFGYSFPVVEQRHHYDVSSFSSDYFQNGPFSGGNYQFANFSIDTVDQYSWFGHTSSYNVSSTSGFGSWFSAPGYDVSSSHYQSSEFAAIHSDSWFGTSDNFSFRDVSSDFSHLQIGSFQNDASHLEIHEGAGVHVQSIFESLDGFAFRDTLIDTRHMQFGNDSFDSNQLIVRAGSFTQYDDIFGNHGVARDSSIDVHNQFSHEGPGSYSSHTEDYSMHSSDSLTSGMSPFMMTAMHVDDMSLLLGHGGKG